MRLYILIVILCLTGCASAPPEGSLAAMKRAETVRQYKACQRYFRSYRASGIILFPNEEVCFQILSGR